MAKKNGQTPRQVNHEAMRVKVRMMKRAGMTNQQIANELGVSKGLCFYYSRSQPGANECPRCTRQFEKK